MFRLLIRYSPLWLLIGVFGVIFLALRFDDQRDVKEFQRQIGRTDEDLAAEVDQAEQAAHRERQLALARSAREGSPQERLELALERYDELVGRESTSESDWQQLLRSLASIQTDQSHSAILAAMRAREVQFKGRGRVFSEVLRDSPHPEVLSTARLVLLQHLKGPRINWLDVGGYYDLIFRRDPSEAAKVLYEVVSKTSGETQAQAASELSRLEDPKLLLRFVGLIAREGKEKAYEGARVILVSCAHTGDPTVLDRVGRIASDPQMHVRVRADAFFALGRSLQPGELESFQALHADQDAPGRLAFLDGLQGLLENPRIARSDSLRPARTVLAEALSSESPPSWNAALGLLMSFPELSNDELLAGVDRLAEKPEIAEEHRERLLSLRERMTSGASDTAAASKQKRGKDSP